MLGKLMKYDMRYMARILPWVYLGSIVLSIFCSAVIIMLPAKIIGIVDVITALFPALCTMAAYAIIIMTVVVIIMRVYRSLYSDEGYLTFTLPVKNSKIIDSKILTGAIWTSFSLIAAVIVSTLPNTAYSIRFYQTEEFLDPGLYVNEVWDYINSALILLIAVTAAFLVPSLYTFCATVTHKAKRARGFASIGMFIGIIYGLSVVSSVIIVVFIAVFAETADYVDYGIVDYNVLSMVLLLIVWFVLAVLTVTSWLVSRHIANKKLNLL